MAIIAVPALLIGLAPNLNHSPRQTSFVIACNLAGIVSASLMAVPAAVFALGWASHSLAALQCLAFALIVLRLRYCVARAAFGSDSRIAALVVLASLITDYGIVQLLGLARF